MGLRNIYIASYQKIVLSTNNGSTAESTHVDDNVRSNICVYVLLRTRLRTRQHITFFILNLWIDSYYIYHQGIFWQYLLSCFCFWGSFVLLWILMHNGKYSMYLEIHMIPAIREIHFGLLLYFIYTFLCMLI